MHYKIYHFTIISFLTLLLIACKENRTGQTVASENNLILKTRNIQYENYLESNLLFNLDGNFKYDLNKIKPIRDKYALLFISAGSDCSTCINQEITYLLRSFRDRTKSVWIVSDSAGLQNLEYEWKRALPLFSVLKVSKNEIINSMGYSGSPLYVLIEKNTGVAFKYFINPNYAVLNQKVVDRIKHRFFL
ncbi:hypothetical protein A3860_33060 [Niastella vici]|uniref:Uncharacterized protein n=1 Tax=Niastella vici TaxID=1703345 RepID=A0A1V9FQA2_9BACT|nr:hypothetical protein [Niastella vici]OQP60498.1 hypothetical protein A3860_33060 [Niastella vici]